MAPAVAFDTLQFSETLITGGFTSPQAEAIAVAFTNAIGQELATKSDLAAVKGELKADIARLDANLAAVKSELKADITRLDAKSDANIARLDVKIDAVEQRLKAEMKAMELRLVIKLGLMMAAMMTLAGGAVGMALRFFLH